jgi:dihydrofolate reductase
MRLTVTTFLTLDGVMQSPEAADEDASGGFDLGGWLPPHVDDLVRAYVCERFERAEAFLLGRRTYDIMAAYWPHTEAPEGGPDFPLNRLPKYVVTTRSDELTWPGTQRLDGALAKSVAELTHRPGGELQVYGSGVLIQSLMAEGLVDAYHLLILPVVLGCGRRLFAGGVPPAGLRLVDCRAFDSGVVMLAYQASGGPLFGPVGG